MPYCRTIQTSATPARRTARCASGRRPRPHCRKARRSAPRLSLIHIYGYTVVYSGTKAQRPADLPADRDYFACNIAHRTEREAAIDYVVSKYGRLDLAVNNAGVAPLVRRDLLEMDEESFDRVLGVNLKGTMFMLSLIHI